MKKNKKRHYKIENSPIVLYLIIIIFIISQIIVLLNFSNNIKDNNSNQIEYDIEYNKADIIAMVTEKITFNRKNIYYIEDKEEFQQILDDFKKRIKALNNILEYCKKKGEIEIIFQATSYLGKTVDRCLNNMSHLVVKNSGISFFYSDILTYIQVLSNPELLKAIKSISNEILFVESLNDIVVFQVNGEYFGDKAKIVYQYQEQQNGNYFTDGVNMGDGWTIHIYGYYEYARLYPDTRFHLSADARPGYTYSEILQYQDSKNWKVIDMRKKIAIIALIIISVTAFGEAFYISRMVLPNNYLEPEKSINSDQTGKFYKTTEIPDLRYADFIPYYRKQNEEFQKALDVFFRYKKEFEEIISLNDRFKYKHDIVTVYLLEDGWKDNLFSVPNSGFLKNYEENFFIFSGNEFSDTAIMPMSINEVLRQRINTDDHIKTLLNSVGKEGNVMEIIFDEKGIWFKLIGPFFKEKVMVSVGYIYKNRDIVSILEEDEGRFEEKYRPDMWIDDHWLIIVPYPASEDSDYEPFNYYY